MHDPTDWALLAALAKDGRATYSELAGQVGIRRSTAHERVRRLEAEKVIRGTHADVDPEQVHRGTLAFVVLEIDVPSGKDCMTCCSGVADRLARLPEVQEFHTIAGSEDAIVKVRAKDLRDLERLVMKEISGTPGVKRVHTRIALSTQFERPYLVLGPAPRKPSGRKLPAKG